VLLGRLAGVEDGGRCLTFASDLEENIRFGDESSAMYKRFIDAYIARECIDVPTAEVDPAEAVAARVPDPPIRSLDLTQCAITTLIWCAGFTGDFGWVQVPGVLDSRGQPAHVEGVAAVPDIYFAGLDFASTRGSGTLFSIDAEAQFLVAHISTRRR
jgi:putative flavoprotein involved in K+ transport